MKRNVLPFVIIAVIGVFSAIIVFYVGVNQREDIQQAEENGEQTEENGNDENEGETDDPEAIFESNCASCHGDDLEGGMGPDLTAVGGELSEDEIHDTIMNGKGDMPAGLVEEDEADALADWLSDME